MLVLSRKLGERILIGQDIELTVVRIDRDRVRIGIKAPSGVTILREEILLEGSGPMDGTGPSAPNDQANPVPLRHAV